MDRTKLRSNTKKYPKSKNGSQEEKESSNANDQNSEKDDQKEEEKVIENNEMKQVVTRNRNEDVKLLQQVLDVKARHESEIKQEIVNKYIPTYESKEYILKKLLDIPYISVNNSKKLFRMFEPRQMPIYRRNGERELRNRWYWKLKQDDIPKGDYDVREHFFLMYERILSEMPDFVLLKDMAVENKNSRDAGKVVDQETALICDRIFEDEETEGLVRRYIADMRQRVQPEMNRVEYPAILHPIDFQFNEYFLQNQLVEPLNNQVIFDYIPNRIRNDPNYILNMDMTLPSIARHVRPNLIQDRLRLFDNFESIWDTMTTSFYILARSVVPDLKELVSTESQIQKMSQDLQLEALTIQSETQFLTGINSQAANECFKTIIAAMLSQRTLSLSFMTTNYMSLISGMYIMTIVPSGLIIRESLVACQLAIINTIIYPAFGMQKMHYRNGDNNTPFELAEQQINNFQVANWLHFVNNNAFMEVQIDGVINQVLNDHIRSGNVINQLMECLNQISRQQFPAMPIDYRRSIQRGVLLLSNRIGQLIDLTRLVSYNYEILMSCITMDMHNVQTLTTEKLQLTSATSLCMLIGNATVIPTPQTLFHYYSTNINFHSHYNEMLNDTVAKVIAANQLNLYQKKMKEIVRKFLQSLYIFDIDRIPDDQMYRLRDRIRRLPVERRRLDVLRIVIQNMDQIEQASDKIAQGVILSYNETPLVHDAMYGYTNIARNIDNIQQINLEELMRSGDYSMITHLLLNNQPVALVGAIPHQIEQSVISLIAKIDATVFAQIVKHRKVDTLKPILYIINSDSPEFYLVVNFNWTPSTTTRIYKQPPQEFTFRESMHMLSSNLSFVIHHDLLSFVTADTVEPINAVAFDGNRIMSEL